MKIHAGLNLDDTTNRKRRYDDDVGKDSPEKYRKVENESRGRTIKAEESNEHHQLDTRRRSFGEPESYKHEDTTPDSRRRSISPRFKRSGSKDIVAYSEHGRGRGYSYQDHGINNHRTYENNRPSFGSYDRDRNFKIDDSDWKTRRMNESLEPERGDGRGYRGKSYDPNYRGLGRGRGRGRGGYGMEMSDSSRIHVSRSGPGIHREVWERGEKGGQ